MRKLLLTTAALVALTADNSFAADLPTKATAYKVPPAYFTWTGCYLGGNVGAASARAKFTTTVDPGTHIGTTVIDRVDAAGTGSDRDTSFIGGGQVGCNLQTGAFVLGVEGDFSGLSTRSTITGAGLLNPNTSDHTFSLTNSLKNDWLATVRGRAGFTVDRSLIYVTGGAAFSKLHYSQVYTDTLAGPTTGGFDVSKTKTGWTIGAGWEYAFTGNWSFKAEYLHVRFSSFSATGLITATGSGNTNVTHGTVREDIDIARVGLNYRFGG